MAVAWLCLVAVAMVNPAMGGLDSWITQDTRAFDHTHAVLLTWKHNEFRRQVEAQNMERMEWDQDLADLAQTRAASCSFDHTPVKGRTTEKYGILGENIKAMTAKGWTVTDPVATWGGEAINYDYSTNHCKDGQVCGHYTQVVWSSSRAVGCGLKYCGADQGGIQGWYDTGAQRNTYAFLVFCMYGKGGNVNGARPYKRGDDCLDCPDGAKYCADGLCSPKPDQRREEVWAHPAMRYSNASEQCIKAYGPGSFLCLSAREQGKWQAEGDVMCDRLYCQPGAKAGEEAAVNCLRTSSAVGVPCGWGKTCNNDKKCVADKLSRSFPGECLHNDQDKVFDARVKKFVSCEDYLEGQPGKCYTDEGMAKCCKTCHAIKDRKDSSCPWGDRHVELCQNPMVCEIPMYLSDCCKTCQKKPESEDDSSFFSGFKDAMSSFMGHDEALEVKPEVEESHIPISFDDPVVADHPKNLNKPNNAAAQEKGEAKESEKVEKMEDKNDAKPAEPASPAAAPVENGSEKTDNAEDKKADEKKDEVKQKKEAEDPLHPLAIDLEGMFDLPDAPVHNSDIHDSNGEDGDIFAAHDNVLKGLFGDTVFNKIFNFAGYDYHDKP